MNLNLVVIEWALSLRLGSPSSNANERYETYVDLLQSNLNLYVVTCGDYSGNRSRPAADLLQRRVGKLSLSSVAMMRIYI